MVVEQLRAKLRINSDISRPCLCAFDVDRTLTGYQESWQMVIDVCFKWCYPLVIWHSYGIDGPFTDDSWFVSYSKWWWSIATWDNQMVKWALPCNSIHGEEMLRWSIHTQVMALVWPHVGLVKPAPLGVRKSYSYWCLYMRVSLKWGYPKSSILIGSHIINHPFWGTPKLGNLHIVSTPYSCA